jgi:DNA-binding GntR family transcriptional regulator
MQQNGLQMLKNLGLTKTEKSKNMSANDRINFQRGITEQNLNAKYLVLYNASAKDANATIVDRTSLDLEFLVDHKAYVFYTDDENEAYYLTAILNSTAPNAMMKDFQSKGLFGARDVQKNIRYLLP